MKPLQQPKTKPTLSLSWKYEAGSPITADIIYTGEKIVVKTEKEDLIALSPQGKRIWKKSLSRKESFISRSGHLTNSGSSPIFKNSKIHVGSRDGNLYTFSSKGKALWRYQTKGQIRSTPAVLQNGNVVFGSNDNSLYAVDGLGNLIWKRSINYPINSRIVSALIDGIENIFFGATDNHLYAYDTHGNLEWKFETEGEITGRVGVGDVDNSGKTSIVLGSNDSSIYSLDLKGRLNWKRETGGVIVSDVHLASLRKGKLDILTGICSSQSNVLIVSGKNELVDSFDAGFWVASAPIFHEGYLVFGSLDHNLYIISWEGRFGNQIHMFNTGSGVSSRPAIAGDKIICANTKGTVYCLSF